MGSGKGGIECGGGCRAAIATRSAGSGAVAEGGEI